MSQPDQRKNRRRRRPIRLVSAFLVLLGLAGYFVVQYESTGGGGPHCTVDAAGTSHRMSLEQAQHAATISAVGVGKGMSDRAVVIAIATAMQESDLRNLDHGDRDSLGLFQQRPSMGWGTPEQIMDPVYSAGIFYDHLAEVRGFEQLPLTVAAQKVQRSGYPDAYAKHEAEASLMTEAFTGRAPASLTCSGPAPQRKGDPEEVRRELVQAFGAGAAPRIGAPGTAGAPGSHGQAVGSGGSTEISLAVNGQNKRRGWELAHWAVAHADELGIQRVSYDSKAWLAGLNRGAWVDKNPGKGGDDDPRNSGPADVRIFVTR
ncbi:hypothetical protein [Streptomyces sp. NPDC090022]|uniref:hypothetical protein n=1 Tax=Streptomyces sp. NPDC090022 TaxID=3365920 RepID=UPI00380ED04C